MAICSLAAFTALGLMKTSLLLTQPVIDFGGVPVSGRSQNDISEKKEKLSFLGSRVGWNWKVR